MPYLFSHLYLEVFAHCDVCGPSVHSLVHCTRHTLMRPLPSTGAPEVPVRAPVWTSTLNLLPALRVTLMGSDNVSPSVSGFLRECIRKLSLSWVGDGPLWGHICPPVASLREHAACSWF